MDQINSGKYRHYKGGECEVLCEARNTETLEELVIYRSLYGQPDFPKGSVWARPKKIFLEKVFVDGVERPRFEFLA